MNGTLLYRVIDPMIDRGRIDAADVTRLQNEVFPEGLTSRDEADILIALDRAIAPKDGCWNEALTRLVVDFVVWASRPTGYVDAETARWMTTSLSCGCGPTPLAVQIAFAVVTESQRVDEILVAFVLRAKRALQGEEGRTARWVRPALAN